MNITISVEKFPIEYFARPADKRETRRASDYDLRLLLLPRLPGRHAGRALCLPSPALPRQKAMVSVFLLCFLCFVFPPQLVSPKPPKIVGRVSR